MSSAAEADPVIRQAKRYKVSLFCSKALRRSDSVIRVLAPSLVITSNGSKRYGAELKKLRSKTLARQGLSECLSEQSGQLLRNRRRSGWKFAGVSSSYTMGAVPEDLALGRSLSPE